MWAYVKDDTVQQTNSVQTRLETNPGVFFQQKYANEWTKEQKEAAGIYEIYKGNYRAFTNSTSPGYSLYITGAGNVRVVPVSEQQAITIPVVANQTLDLQVERVNATSTTATGIIALEVQQ